MCSSDAISIANQLESFDKEEEFALVLTIFTKKLVKRIWKIWTIFDVEEHHILFCN